MSTYKEVLQKAIEAAKNDKPSVILAFDKLSYANVILSKIFDDRNSNRISAERMVNIDGINIVGKSISQLKQDKYYSVVVAFNPNEQQENHLNNLNIGKLITVKN